MAVGPGAMDPVIGQPVGGVVASTPPGAVGAEGQRSAGGAGVVDGVEGGDSDEGDEGDEEGLGFAFLRQHLTCELDGLSSDGAVPEVIHTHTHTRTDTHTHIICTY